MSSIATGFSTARIGPPHGRSSRANGSGDANQGTAAEAPWRAPSRLHRFSCLPRYVFPATSPDVARKRRATNLPRRRTSRGHRVLTAELQQLCIREGHRNIGVWFPDVESERDPRRLVPLGSAIMAILRPDDRLSSVSQIGNRDPNARAAIDDFPSPGSRSPFNLHPTDLMTMALGPRFPLDRRSGSDPKPERIQVPARPSIPIERAEPPSTSSFCERIGRLTLRGPNSLILGPPHRPTGSACGRGARGNVRAGSRGSRSAPPSTLEYGRPTEGS
jgi:hypothetical protein